VVSPLQRGTGAEAGGHVGVVGDTDELIYELQDQVQRGNQMLALLCKHAGIDPDEARRLPGEAPPRNVAVVELPVGP
jgi:hypothetical protein